MLFWEEPVLRGDIEAARLDLRRCGASGVVVATPQLPAEADRRYDATKLSALLDTLITPAAALLVRWYYTPMMLPFSEHIAADCVVYDRVDELANFKGAPAELLPLEERLLDVADLVFTGGYSLYEAKAGAAPDGAPVPSSVEVAHSRRARGVLADPADQAALPGVDSRLLRRRRTDDLELLAALADARPGWSIVIVGPVVKISEADLPPRQSPLSRRPLV